MIGERLRQCRARHEWSQHELARRADVPQALISRLEAGRRASVTTEVAKRLALALGTSIDYLVGTWDNAATPPPETGVPAASAEAPAAGGRRRRRPHATTAAGG